MIHAETQLRVSLAERRELDVKVVELEGELEAARSHANSCNALAEKWKLKAQNLTTLAGKVN